VGRHARLALMNDLVNSGDPKKNSGHYMHFKNLFNYCDINIDKSPSPDLVSFAAVIIFHIAHQTFNNLFDHPEKFHSWLGMKFSTKVLDLTIKYNRIPFIKDKLHSGKQDHYTGLNNFCPGAKRKFLLEERTQKRTQFLYQYIIIHD
jgi:hypothetical protein